MSPHDIAYVALRSLLGFGALVLAAVVLWRAVRGTLPRGREGVDAAIARPDAALYRAKQEGRGRVVEGIEAVGALRDTRQVRSDPVMIKGRDVRT